MQNLRDTGPKSSVKEPLVVDVPRTPYDLSHFTFKVGSIGGLQTLSCIKIVAGDSMEMDARFVFRLSQLRRNLYMDLDVQLYAFYLPDRHIYGSDFVDFLKAGQDEGITLGTDSLQTDATCMCVGFPLSANIARPRWLIRGPIQIYNNYFKDLQASNLADNYLTTLAANTAALDYGVQACHLKRIWNTGIVSTLSSADYSLPLSGGEVNLYELAQLKARLSTETARDFYALRYRDVLEYAWSSHVNIDADQRSELVARSRNWLSGQDVNATDTGSLGSYTGKAVGVSRLMFPRKFFPEHGTLWIMGCLRFPPIYSMEVSPIVGFSEPTYKQIAGDPTVIRREPPITLTADQVLDGNAAVDLGKVPYAQWFREQPHLMHFDYVDSAGHPFINPGVISSRNDMVQISHSLYDSVFTSTQLKHWNVQGHIGLWSNRFIPDPQRSIFAGTE